MSSKFLDNIFNKREKQIGDSSKKLYTRNLEKMNNNNEVTDLTFLKNTSEILKFIAKYKPTTQRSFIISICTVLKNNDDKLYNQYFELLSKFNNDLKINVDKSEKQTKNWIEESDIQTIYNDVRTKASEKKTKSKDSFDNMLNYLIISLYILQAPRRNIDYTLMKISSDMTDTNFNYLDLKNKQFIFNNYKTQGKYNSVNITIEPDLFIVINKYIKIHPEFKKMKNKSYNFHFLVNYNRDEINKSQNMTLLLNKIFNKKIGSSMLRNMFLTTKYGKIMKELKVDVADMGTSVDVALNNYIKNE